MSTDMMIHVEPLPQVMQAAGLTLADGATADQRDQLVVLMSILHGMTGNMLSPDAVYLSMCDALAVAEQFGVSQDKSKPMIQAFMAYSKALRKRNPMSCLFEN